jgi:hypothetical protein
MLQNDNMTAMTIKSSTNAGQLGAAQQAEHGCGGVSGQGLVTWRPGNRT